MAFDVVMWLTAEQREIFVIACVFCILKSLSECESNCANSLHVIYVQWQEYLCYECSINIFKGNTVHDVFSFFSYGTAAQRGPWPPHS